MSLSAAPAALKLVAYCDSTTEIGGAEGSLATLVGALGDHVEVTVMGVDAEVVGWLARLRASAETCVVRRLHSWRDPAGFADHLRALRRIRPDVLHVSQTSPWYGAYPLGLGTLLPGVRTVSVTQLLTPPPDAAAQRRTRAVAKRLDARVAVGRRSATELEGLLDLPAGSVRAIHNGVPDVALDPVPPGDGLVIGSLGRLHEQKGYDVLLRALAGVPDARLVLVGDGPERAALQALARELGVAGRVEITGWEPDARGRLPGFDVFALPSRFEALPLSIAEAMLAGLPVVATDVGSVTEIVLDGDTGYVVPAGQTEPLRDGLARLLADADLRRRMGERGRAHARAHFTATTMAAAFEALYAEIAR